MIAIHVFSTELGPIGVAIYQAHVCRLTLGHVSEYETQAWLAAWAPRGLRPRDPAPSDLAPCDLAPCDLAKASGADQRAAQRAERLLQAYAAGQRVDLARIAVDRRLERRTEFQRSVLDACQQVPYGARIEYGQLAAQIGRPGAARAVGAVMASNRVPLLIPCHRVVGVGGKLGGFSAPQGLALKKRLLDLEKATSFAAREAQRGVADAPSLARRVRANTMEYCGRPLPSR